MMKLVSVLSCDACCRLSELGGWRRGNIIIPESSQFSLRSCYDIVVRGFSSTSNKITRLTKSPKILARILFRNNDSPSMSGCETCEGFLRSYNLSEGQKTILKVRISDVSSKNKGSFRLILGFLKISFFQVLLKVGTTLGFIISF